MFSCEIWGIFKNTFFTEYLRVSTMIPYVFLYLHKLSQFFFNEKFQLDSQRTLEL